MEKSISARSALVLAAVLIVLIILSSLLTFYFTKQASDNSYKDLENKYNQLIQKIETGATPIVSATPAATTEYKSYKYDYLDMTLVYPSNWTITEKMSNDKAGGYSFSCESATDFIKNNSLCVNGEVTPRNLVLKSPEGSRITFWNANGLGGINEVPQYTTIQSFQGKAEIILYSNNQGEDYATFIGSTFTPGAKSVWKSYLVSVEGEKSVFNDIKYILENSTISNQ